MKRSLTILIAIAALLAGGGVLLMAARRSTPTKSVATTGATPDLALTSPASTPSSTVPPGLPTASSTPTIRTPVATPSMIIVNRSTPVTVSVQITDPSLIPNSVNLLRLNATATQPTILGQLPCNASGTCAAPFTFNEQALGQIQLEVSAAFRGLLKRIISQPVQVAVWGALTDPTSGFTAFYPPGLYLTFNDTSSDIFFLDSSANGVAIGDAIPSGSSEAITGYRIIIAATPYTVSNQFDINQYLNKQYPNSAPDVGSITSTPIGGQTGYEFTFQNEEGGGKPVAVVYRNGFVYTLRYASTNNIAGFSERDGLNAFNGVVQNFTFN